MAKNPCKYYLKDGRVLSYDEMRQYLLENYETVFAAAKGDKQNRRYGLAYSDTELLREELGITPRAPQTPMNAQEKREEAAKLVEKGAIPDILRRIESMEDTATAVEHLALVLYSAELNEQVSDAIKANDTKRVNKLMDEIERLFAAAELSGHRLGRDLGTRNTRVIRDGSLSMFLSDMKADAYSDELSPEQIKRANENYQKLEAAKKEADDKLIKLQAEFEAYKAQQQFSNAKKNGSKKTHAERVAERRDIKDRIRAKLEAARQRNKIKIEGKDVDVSKSSIIPVPSASEIIEILPEIKELFRSYAGEVGQTLDGVIDKIYDEVSDLVDGITKRDIRKAIAGEFDEKKKTRNELAKERYELAKEAELLEKIEKIKEGILPSTPTPKIESANRRLTELARELDKLYRAQGIGKYSEQKKFETAARASISANKKRIAEIDEKLKKGDFSEEKKKDSILTNKEFQKANEKLYQEYLDSENKKYETQLEYERARVKEREKNLSTGGKIGKVVDIVSSTWTAIRAGFDQSVVMVQNAPFTFSHPYEALKNFAWASRFIFNAQLFNREVAKTHASDIWDLMEKSGVAMYEPRTAKAELRNELFGGDKNLLNKNITINGKKYSIGQAFERATSANLNAARRFLFTSQVADLKAAGKTFENSPEAYKAAARVANELTGHGKPLDAIQKGSAIWNKIIWSVKMMSSTMNLLGLGDIVRPIGIYESIVGKQDSKYDKGFYSGLSPEARKFAIKEMGRFIAFGLVAMYAIKLSHALLKDDEDEEEYEVDLDPLSVTFGSIKMGKKSYYPFGRFTSMIKTIGIVVAGERHMGERVDILGDKYGDKTRSDIAFKGLVRGKMRPDAGVAYDLLFNERKDYFTGEKLTLKAVAERLLIPMSLSSIPEDISRDGAAVGLAETLFKFVGASLQDETAYKETSEKVKRQLAEDSYSKEDLKIPEWRYLYSKGVKKPSKSDRWDYEVDIDKKHPDGVMTATEYEKFVEYAIADVKADISALMKNNFVSTTDDKGRVVYKRGADLDARQIAPFLRKYQAKATAKAKKKVLSGSKL